MENKVFEHVMLDLETMGNKSNSALISIGAVEFDINTGEIGSEFYKRIDLQSCLDCGLKINASTVYWWLTQNRQAQEEVAKGGDDLALVLNEFRVWLSRSIKGVKLWGNGARFDIGLLEDAYVACGYKEMPWGFREERDLRTLTAFAPEIKMKTVQEWKLTQMVEHHPIDDCKMQIAYASEIWNQLSFSRINAKDNVNNE